MSEIQKNNNLPIKLWEVLQQYHRLDARLQVEKTRFEP